uniref:EGF-like domain-containing protein n=1 Tax=Rhabditophanes sp. KR3021 TaxID=114890 RepID=A0AC35U030_9BILA
MLLLYALAAFTLLVSNVQGNKDEKLAFLNPQSACRVICQNAGVCAYKIGKPRQHKCICMAGQFEGDFCEIIVNSAQTTTIPPTTTTLARHDNSVTASIDHRPVVESVQPFSTQEVFTSTEGSDEGGGVNWNGSEEKEEVVDGKEIVDEIEQTSSKEGPLDFQNNVGTESTEHSQMNEIGDEERIDSSEQKKVLDNDLSEEENKVPDNDSSEEEVIQAAEIDKVEEPSSVRELSTAEYDELTTTTRTYPIHIIPKEVMTTTAGAISYYLQADDTSRSLDDEGWMMVKKRNSAIWIGNSCGQTIYSTLLLLLATFLQFL